MTTRRPDTDDRLSSLATPLALRKHLWGQGRTVIDTHQHAPLARVSSGRQPHALAVHPGGRWWYLPSLGSNTPEVDDPWTLVPGADRDTFLDPASLKVVARGQTGGAPQLPQFRVGGQVCYFPSIDADTVTVLDTASQHAVETGGDYDSESADPVVATIELLGGSAASRHFCTDRRGFQ